MVNDAGTLSLSLDFKENNMPPAFNNNTAMAVYRVLAELINNTIKHANATNIYITIAIAQSAIYITYADDGKGFVFNSDASSKGMGLQNIESRLNMINAVWQLPTGQVKGFNMEITIPLN